MQTGEAKPHVDVKKTKTVVYPTVVEYTDDIGVTSLFIHLIGRPQFCFDVLSCD
jgi:hypothetical protein